MAERIYIPGIKDAIKDWQGFRKEVNLTAKELVGLIQEANKVTSAFQNINSLKEFNDFANKAAESTAKIKVSTDGLTASQKKLFQANAQLNISLSAEAKAIQSARLETSRLTKTSKQLAILSSSLSTEYEKQSTKLNQLRKRQKDLNTTQKLGGKLTKEQVKELKSLTRQVQKLDKALKEVDAEAGQFQRNVGNYSKAMQGAASAARSLGSALGFGGAVALTALAIRDAVKTILEFDKQLIAVSKTTDISGDALKTLGEDIRELSIRTDGVSLQGLLNSAEIAGTLGAKSTDDILIFSKAIEQLKLTSDIVGEDSVRNLAKFITVAGVGFQATGRIGSALTDLGNNFATTENQILSNSTEIIKGVSIYNTSESAILALGTATSSLGLQAEQARSGIQSTFLVLEDAADGGKALTDVLRITGLTQSELSRQFKNDATGVFKQFVSGLSDINKAGGSVTQELDKLNLKNKQSINTLGALAKNFNVLEESTLRSGKAYKENSALSKEAESAAESISSKIGDVGNAWDDFILSLEDGSGVISTTFKDLLDFTEDAIKALKILNLTEKERIKLYANDNAEKNYKDQQQAIRLEATLSRKTIDEVAAAEAFRIAGEIEDIKKLQKAKKEEFLSNSRDLKEIANERAKFIKDNDVSDLRLILTSNGESSTLFGDLGDLNKETRELTSANEELKKQIEETEGVLIKYNAEIEASEDLQKDVSGTITKDFIGASKQQLELTKEQEKASKKQQKLLKQRRKDAFDLAKQRLKNAIDINKSITDNENESLENRLKANNNYVELSQDLFELERMFYVNEAKGRADEITRIEEDIQNKLTELTVEGEENRDRAFKETFKNRVDSLVDIVDRQEEALELEAAVLSKSLRDQGKSVVDIEKEVTQLLREERKKQLQDAIDAIESELAVLATSAEQKKLIAQELTKLKLELLGIEAEEYEESEEERIDFAEKAKEAILDTLFTIADAISAGFDNRVSNIDAEIEKVNEAEDRRLENFEGNEQQKKDIQDSAEAQREQLELKKRKEQQKQARFDKAIALASIAIDTAKAIAKVSPVIPLMVLAAAQGAIQAAVVASTPIPAYEKGKKANDSYKGSMLWGEKQTEVKKDKYGKIQIATKPTIGYTVPGDTIYPSLKAFNDANPNTISPNLINASVASSLKNDEKRDNFINDYIMSMGSQVNKGIKSGFNNVKILNQTPKEDRRFQRISNKVNF